MPNQDISSKTKSIFESILKLDDEGNEYWLARELMPVLEYNKWSNFERIITKSKLSLSRNYPQSDDHFAEVSKKIKVAAGTEKEAIREIKDYKLTRYACYLIAQNGDSSKNAIALAQNYFAQQTRKQELVEEKEKNIERILARRKLSETEKKFAGVLAERNVDGRGIAEIKSAGDQALFGKPTRQVKEKMGIKDYKPLADHLPTISIKAKDLATEMTTYKTLSNNLDGKDPIKKEHISNNSAVRNMLTESGIYPERLPAEEDIKKLERKISEEEIHELEESKLLAIDLIEIDIRNVLNKQELEQIKSIITNNQGNSIIKIYYGNSEETKVIERDIQINSEVINNLKKYIVITDSNVDKS